ncbi:ribosomal-processing cysteine protease Prp [Vagococcus hydrophili]|uniref:Ribosomal processing cysteine protease Prp n=1 Tax=Vagococcus hydrophili TaxID=2714947 RepID=A0A6G8AQ28_9ENTE|nr:ribosomal-processing cysteine protease Prp [Vagococcus hydrophili]QIL47042.1 ribosomal-processing cysteine protease Prp [Vagococcus hydrophili]
MIIANFKEANNRYTFSITGHANFDDIGKDIVCAAVSVLTTAIVNEVNRFGVMHENNDESISFSFIAVQTSQSPTDCHLYRLYEMLKENLQEIERQYPENMKVVLE